MHKFIHNTIAAAVLAVPAIVGVESAFYHSDIATSAEAHAQALDVTHDNPALASHLHDKAKDQQDRRNFVVEVALLGEVVLVLAVRDYLNGEGQTPNQTTTTPEEQPSVAITPAPDIGPRWVESRQGWTPNDTPHKK